MSMLEAAQTHARDGWPVFVLGRSKRPLANCPDCPQHGHPGHHTAVECKCGTPTCHGFYAATRHLERIAAMLAAHPGGLLAVRTGAAPDGAGVVGIDIDPRHGGQLVDELMPPTRAVATGSGGWHLYYQHPGTPVSSRPLPDVPGVDVKADGGYLVLPPSIHPDTRQPYRWTNHRPIKEMPPRLHELATQPAPATSGLTAPRFQYKGDAPTGGVVKHPARMVTVCLDAVREAPEGRRRYTLYGAARGIARAIHAGYPSDCAVDELVDTGRAAGQTERDIRAAITAAFAAEGLHAR